MLKKPFVWIFSGALTLIATLSMVLAEQNPGGSAPGSPPQPVLLKSGDLKWAEAPPTVPKGARMALVYGDPATGPYAQFVKIPKGYVFRPHFHSQNEWVTIISGRMAAGFGTEMDMSAGKELSAGGFAFIPTGTPHWAVAKSDVLFYQQVGGAASISYVDRSDDPRGKPR